MRELRRDRYRVWPSQKHAKKIQRCFDERAAAGRASLVSPSLWPADRQEGGAISTRPTSGSRSPALTAADTPQCSSSSPAHRLASSFLAARSTVRTAAGVHHRGSATNRPHLGSPSRQAGCSSRTTSVSPTPSRRQAWSRPPLQSVARQRVRSLPLRSRVASRRRRC